MFERIFGMPLIQGYSESAFKKNIRTLIKDGYPRKQALAIAYNIHRKALKKYKSRKYRNSRKSNVRKH